MLLEVNMLLQGDAKKGRDECLDIALWGSEYWLRGSGVSRRGYASERGCPGLEDVEAEGV
jgi:hypothetical protein